MIVTIHQPEHFPYMGFFQKINQADVFVVLDNVKFRKNYFQNRNKIKTKSGQDIWITVPVERSADSKEIRDVMVSTDIHWRRKLLRTIQDNLGFDASEIYNQERLIDINMSSIEWSMKNLKINKPIVMASSLNPVGNKSEMLADIVRKLGGKKYISGPSGKEYLDLSFFSGISVDFFEPSVDNHYSCLYNILK